MKRKQKQTAARKRGHVGTIALVCVFLLGLSLLIYPSFSNWWNERAQTRAVLSYGEAVSSLSDEDYSAIFEAADAYNEALATLDPAAAFMSDEPVAGYEETLDITGTGIMGYLTIEKINVELPIYHGTSDSVLSSGAGHLEGSSLPVGGESTHCILSAHRGLPSALLFTNLDQLEVGDTFTITVLNRVLTYKVDLISIVLPDEIEYLYVEDGKDYCTLMTCTPYGINTHRLLVRGVRTTDEDEALMYVTADAYQVDPLLVALVLAVPMLLVLLIGLLTDGPRSRKKRTEQDRREG